MITYPATPVVLDAFMVEFNTKIAALLPWLNNPLGKVQTVTTMVGGGKVKTPRMFVAGKEYNIEVYPSDKMTNFSWFVFGDEEPVGRAKFKTTVDFNLFIDLSKIYPLITESRNLENVKLQVFEALETITLESGAIRINSISEDYEDVYSGYALPELQDKYFMQPYAGLNFNLDAYILNTNAICPSPVTADSVEVGADSIEVDASGGTI